MSYARTPNTSRGPGAIAALDGQKTRRMQLLEAQRRQASLRKDYARAMAARGGLRGLGVDPTHHQDGGGGGHPGGGGGGGGGVPGFIGKIFGSVTSRPIAPVQPGRVAPKVILKGSAQTKPKVILRAPVQQVKRSILPQLPGQVVPLPEQPAPGPITTPTVSTSSGGGGGGGGEYWNPTTDEYADGSDAGGELAPDDAAAAPSSPAATAGGGKKLLLLAGGAAALWWLLRGKD